MKKLALLSILALTLFSCNSDDDSSPVATPKNYIPMNLDNHWSYGNSFYGNIETEYNGTATLNGNTFNRLVNQQPFFGIQGVSNIRKENDNYFVTGDIQLYDLPSVSVVDLPFLNENLSGSGEITNQTISTLLDTFDYSQGAVSLTIRPEMFLNIRINQVNKYESKELNGEIYNDVVELDWTYDLSVVLSSENNSAFQLNPHELISPQRIAHFKVYYANDIGVVRSTFDVDLTEVEFNTSVPILGSTIDITNYIQGLMDFFSEEEFVSTSELTSYEVF